MENIYLKVIADGTGEDEDGDKVPYVLLSSERFAPYGIDLSLEDTIAYGMSPKPDYSPRVLADAWWIKNRQETADRVIAVSHLLYIEDVKGDYYEVFGLTAEAIDGRPSVLVEETENVQNGDVLHIDIDLPAGGMVNIVDPMGFIRGIGVYDNGQWVARYMV
jgi:hypothetical protein